MKKEIPLIEAAMKLQEELLMPVFADVSDEPLAAEENVIENQKKVFLLISGTAAQKYGEKIQKEQEVLSRMADMAIEVYAAESALLRTKKIIMAKGAAAAELAIKMTECYVTDMVPKMEAWAKEVLVHMEEGDTRRTLLSALRKLTRFEPVDVYVNKRAIVDAVYAGKKYKVL